MGTVLLAGFGSAEARACARKRLAALNSRVRTGAQARVAALCASVGLTVLPRLTADDACDVCVAKNVRTEPYRVRGVLANTLAHEKHVPHRALRSRRRRATAPCPSCPRNGLRRAPPPAACWTAPPSCCRPLLGCTYAAPAWSLVRSEAQRMLRATLTQTRAPTQTCGSPSGTTRRPTAVCTIQR